MDSVSKRFLGLGIVFLFLGLVSPWVTLAPPSVKHDNLQRIADLFSLDWMPEWALTFLQEQGLRPNMSAEDVLEVVSEGGLAPVYSYLQMRRSLFVWDLFILPYTSFGKVIFVLVILIWFLSLITLTREWRQGRLPNPPDSFNADFDVMSSPRRRGFPWSGVIGLFALVVFLLFARQIPFLDSLGHWGEWVWSILDVLNGARVAFPVRLFVPVGLLMVGLSGVGPLIEWYFQLAPEPETYPS